MLMTGNFKLKADFNPSGDQPEAIDALLRGLREGLSLIHILRRAVELIGQPGIWSDLGGKAN